MDASKLTTKAQEALSAAIRQASSAGNPDVTPVHLLLALLEQPEGIAKPLLEAVKADPVRLRAAAERLNAGLTGGDDAARVITELNALFVESFA